MEMVGSPAAGFTLKIRGKEGTPIGGLFFAAANCPAAAADNSNVHWALFCPDAHPQKALPRQTAQNTPGKFYLN